MIDVTREKPISLAQAARHFGVTVRTVRTWTQRIDNPLEAVRAGRRVVTSMQALARFVRPASAAKPKTSREEQHEEALRRLHERHGMRIKNRNLEFAG